jgi:pimeloyl-ACP methyl ester carboxylesterase
MSVARRMSAFQSGGNANWNLSRRIKFRNLCCALRQIFGLKVVVISAAPTNDADAPAVFPFSGWIALQYVRYNDCRELAMPKLNRDGVNIHYEVHGSGPPLLLTHGYSSTSAMWQGQIAPLSKHHTLILWDMRGHGQSDYPADPLAYSEALTVGDMAALLDKVSADSAIIGGLSLGGYMSLAFYRAHPERVRALLIIDTGPGFRKDDARDAWNKRALETGARFEREGLEVLKSASRERSSVVHRDASGLARAARGMLTQRDAGVIETLPHIKVPALVVVGADDTPFLAASDYMAAKIPGAQKVVIPAAGHAANIDQPQAFIDAVLPFLDSLPPAAASGQRAAS